MNKQPKLNRQRSPLLDAYARALHNKKQVMQELIFRTTHPDHYQRMKDRQQALSNGPQPGLLNLSDALEQNARSIPNNKDDQQKLKTQ